MGVAQKYSGWPAFLKCVRDLAPFSKFLEAALQLPWPGLAFHTFVFGSLVQVWKYYNLFEGT